MQDADVVGIPLHDVLLALVANVKVISIAIKSLFIINHVGGLHVHKGVVGVHPEHLDLTDFQFLLLMLRVKQVFLLVLLELVVLIIILNVSQLLSICFSFIIVRTDLHVIMLRLRHLVNLVLVQRLSDATLVLVWLHKG